MLDDADGNVTQVFYSYNVSGVDYESSQSLSPEQQRLKNRYIPGAQSNHPLRPAPASEFNRCVGTVISNQLSVVSCLLLTDVVIDEEPKLIMTTDY